MRIIVQEWITLDGVFDAATFDEWFGAYHSEERAAHIQDNILGCDALLMGANTYESLAPYWSSLRSNEMGIADKLNRSPKYVVSREPLQSEWENTQPRIEGDVAGEVARLKEQSGGYLLVPGSARLVQTLMGAGLADEYRLLIHPVVLGHGKRFFAEGMPMTRLEPIATEQLPYGVLATTYAPAEGTRS